MVNGEELQVLYVREKAECEEDHGERDNQTLGTLNSLICNHHRLYRSLGALLLPNEN
jgi:hypothetical protein